MLYPKKNVIKLFNDSSVWAITGAASLVSPTVMKLVANSAYIGVPAYIDVKPLTQYTFSLKWEGTGSSITPRLDCYTDSAFISQVWNNTVTASYWTYTFTTPATCTRIRLLLQNSNNTGTFYFIEPQLEEGATATPYEPYQLTNKRAVMSPKKNLFTLEGSVLTSAAGSFLTILSPNDLIVTSGTNSFTAARTANMKVKPNTQYTISYTAERVNSTDNPRVSPRKGSDNSGITLSDGVGDKTLTFNTGNETEIYFLLYGNMGTATVQSNKYSKIQVEEGVQTAFEPYQLTNKRAKQAPKKNLVPPLTDKSWVLNPFVKIFDDYSMTMENATGSQWVSVDIPIEVGKTYVYSHDSNLGMYTDIRNDTTYHTKVQDGAPPNVPVKVTHPDAKFMRVAYNVTNTSPNYMKNMQLEEGTVKTPFEPYQLTNKRASLSPKKNLIPNINSFPNTNDSSKLKFENENRLIMNATSLSDYLNVQFPAKKLQQYTFWATELNENARVAIREVKADGTKTFLTNLTQIYMSHTFTTSSNAEKIEIECTVKNVGLCIFDRIQLEEGSKTSFEPYALRNKPAVLYPAKNFILPFDKWVIDDNVTINFIERTPSRVVMDVTVQNAYRGLRMPIDWNIFKQLLGKDVTLSVKGITNTGSAAQLQLRFYGGASGNTDFVNTGTGANAINKKVPDDATQAFLVYQLNSPGTLRLTLDSPQLEIGSTATPYEPYRLGNKRA